MELNQYSQSLLEVLSSNKKVLDKIVLDFLPKSSASIENQSLFEMMRDYPSRGGKGIRGSTCLFWCELFGGKKEKALVTAAALELFQNWILIHDDVEDQSDLRRGLPALHKKFGAELAINAGDALHGKMWELLLTNKKELGPQLTLQILSEFSRMLNETTEGQNMELSWTLGQKWDITEKQYIQMVTKKASWYTCISPSRLGILLSTANSSRISKTDPMLDEVLDRTIRFGTDLGIAFQIVDDILNLTAEESKYGKEILGDLFEGKRTLMLIHLLNISSSETREKIIGILSKPRQLKTNSEMVDVFKKMKDSDSIDYAKGIATQHSRQALKDFDEIVSEHKSMNPDIYKFTKNLMEYLSSRDY